MNVLDFFFLPHHSWRPAPVAQTVPPWPSQTLSSQYLQDHKDSLPAPCAYLYKDMFIMKILQKCYKNQEKVLLIGNGCLVREHYIQCPPNSNMHGYSFHYKYMYNRINQDILVSDLEWASGSTCLSVGCAPVLQHCPGTRKCTQTQHPPYLCYTGPFCSCRICNIPSNTLRPRHHS